MITTNLNETILTPRNFEMLLKWLNEDREIAGYKYESIRFKLKKFFYARGCTHAEELADATIDRVLNKIEVLQKNYIGNPILYFMGVAKYVFLEYVKKDFEKELPPNLTDKDWFNDDDTEHLYFCLHESLQKIPAKEREFILEYYSGSKKDKIRRRKQMSRKLNISNQTMHVQAFRIRTKLHKFFMENLDNEG